jgi:hypothetical protein
LRLCSFGFFFLGLLLLFATIQQQQGSCTHDQYTSGSRRGSNSHIGRSTAITGSLEDNVFTHEATVTDRAVAGVEIDSRYRTRIRCTGAIIQTSRDRAIARGTIETADGDTIETITAIPRLAFAGTTPVGIGTSCMTITSSIQGGTLVNVLATNVATTIHSIGNGSRWTIRTEM